MIKHKTILFIANDIRFLSTHRMEIIRYLVDAGYEIYITAPASSNMYDISFYIDMFNDLGCVFIPASFSRGRQSLARELFSMRELRGLYVNLRPKYVHVVTLKPYLYVAFSLIGLSYKSNFIYAIAGLGSNIFSKPISSKFVFFIVAILLKYAPTRDYRYIFQNSYDLNFFRNNLKIGSKFSLTHGSGVDLSLFLAKNRNELSEFEPIIIGFASRLVVSKGILTFIEVCRKLYDSGLRNLKFVIAGEIDSSIPNDLTKSQLSKFSDSYPFEFLGHIDDMPSFFSNINIFFYPSTYGEGVPKVLLESVASGVPVVTSNKPGCSDAILDEYTGYISENDVSSYVEILKYLIENNSMLVSFSKNCRSVRDVVSVDHVVSQHASIYKSF